MKLDQKGCSLAIHLVSISLTVMVHTTTFLLCLMIKMFFEYKSFSPVQRQNLRQWRSLLQESGVTYLRLEE